MTIAVTDAKENRVVKYISPYLWRAGEQLESDFRMRLFQSAERAGGQRVIHVTRYPAKKKQTFEQYMSRPRRSSTEARIRL